VEWGGCVESVTDEVASSGARLTYF
jgi:hypothetical protein